LSFPADLLGPKVSRRCGDPAGFPLLAVGGVDALNIADHLAARSAAGIGTSIFRPGMSADEVGTGQAMVTTYDRVAE
jgi:2-keto-3-deoxy-6-phosphogluconate aldolase